VTVIIDNLAATVTAGTSPPPPRRFNITAAETEGLSAEHQVRSPYVEEHWLTYLGPTALLLARHVDAILANAPKGAVDVERVADQIGVSPHKIVAAIDRLRRYGLATWSSRDALLTLQRRWPDVPAAIQTPRHREALIRIADQDSP
jgi:hypothetical protein